MPDTVQETYLQLYICSKISRNNILKFDVVANPKLFGGLAVYLQTRHEMRKMRWYPAQSLQVPHI